MILILEITSPQPAKAGSTSRQTFSQDGGSIGRDRDNSWVLPHAKVSGHHALISYRDGGFYIEDISRNGVCINSSKNRLVHGRQYVLTAGDRLLIDPYEIEVSITRDQSEAGGRQYGALSDVQPSDLEFGASGPFDIDDPFAPRPLPSSGLEESLEGQEVDPLELLNLAPKRAPVPKPPRAKDLDFGSLMDGHFQPPDVLPAPAPPPPPRGNPVAIPQDYDPLAPDEPSSLLRASSPPPPPRERPHERPYERPHVAVNLPDDELPEPVRVAPPPLPSRAAHSEPLGSLAPGPIGADHPSAADFSAVLAGAGLDPANVTSELARTFGQILRVVVSGVMDVMRSRQQIKDEFRMRMTRFRTTENNPLKFSANVEDALHNLLVKRNPAYLGPVESFEDAFADLRNHQLAMLAGMRAGPNMVTPNKLEAEELVGHEFENSDELSGVLTELVELGPIEAAVTLPDGCAAVVGEGPRRRMLEVTIEPLDPAHE